jgi:hypothetical protein
MKRTNSSLALIGIALALTLFIPTHVSAQIRLNEVEVDTPNSGAEPCEYIEVLGKPSSIVPAGTFFLSIDSDTGQLGFVDYVANLGGVRFGSNGTITIVSNSDVCPGRTFPSETTLVKSASVAIGFGAETLLLTKSLRPKLLFEGQDLDVNNDGVLDASFGLSPIDGIGWVIDPTHNKVYGGAATIFQGREWPDAATRFPGNSDAFSAAAWYYGEVAPPENSPRYKSPLSSNFPQGGVLTPGAPNAGVTTGSQLRRQTSHR